MTSARERRRGTAASALRGARQRGGQRARAPLQGGHDVVPGALEDGQGGVGVPRDEAESGPDVGEVVGDEDRAPEVAHEAGPQLAVGRLVSRDEQGHVVEAQLVEEPVVEDVVLAGPAGAERRRNGDDQRLVGTPRGAPVQELEDAPEHEERRDALLARGHVPGELRRAGGRHGQVLRVHALPPRRRRERGRGEVAERRPDERDARVAQGEALAGCACPRPRAAGSRRRRGSAARAGAAARGAPARRKLVDDVEEGLDARVEAGVGGVGVDLEDEVGLLAHHPAQVVQHERVRRAGEVRDPGQVEVRRLLDAGDRLHVLLAVVPVHVGEDRRRLVVDHVEGHDRHAARGELARDAHVGVAREGVVRPPEEPDVEAVGPVAHLRQHLAAAPPVAVQEGAVVLDRPVEGAAPLGGA